MEDKYNQRNELIWTYHVAIIRAMKGKKTCKEVKYTRKEIIWTQWSITNRNLQAVKELVEKKILTFDINETKTEYDKIIVGPN